MPWLWLVLTACTGEVVVDHPLASELQAALDEGRVSAGAPGATMAVIHPEHGLWVGASGEADDEADIATVPGDRFGLGRITKTFVATLVLRHAAQGALDLDEVASAWTALAPHGDQYTVRMLLAHQSGLDDFVDEPGILADPARVWTAAEVVALVADAPLQFEPGTRYEYTNTNYVILGQILEAVGGDRWGVQVRADLLDPVGLSDTFLPSEGDEPDQARGHLGGADVTGTFHPTIAGAAGEMISDAEDVARWGEALYLGDVLDPDSLEAMLTAPPPNTHYGLGAFIDDLGDTLPEHAGVQLVGHSGSIMGFQARLHVHQESGVVVATLANDFLAEADVIDALAWEVLFER